MTENKTLPWRYFSETEERPDYGKTIILVDKASRTVRSMRKSTDKEGNHYENPYETNYRTYEEKNLHAWIYEEELLQTVKPVEITKNP